MTAADAPAPKPSGGLRERAMTAAVLAPVGIAAVMLLPQTGFAVALAALFLVAAWEWSRLIGLGTAAVRFTFIAVQAVLFVWAWRAEARTQSGVIACGVLFWLIAPLWLRHFRFGEGTGRRSRLLKTLAGCLAIVPAWTAAIALHGGPRGPQWVLFLLVLVWCADSCAYFAGRRFGTTKLAPNISPGKTIAGVHGAWIGSAIYAALVGHFGFGVALPTLLPFVALCLVTVLFSIVGDLFESLIKRHAGEKDSGTLFPGHGGALDRFDSMFAALPLFWFGRQLIGL